LLGFLSENKNFRKRMRGGISISAAKSWIAVRPAVCPGFGPGNAGRDGAWKKLRARRALHGSAEAKRVRATWSPALDDSRFEQRVIKLLTYLIKCLGYARARQNGGVILYNERVFFWR
jgi:hypothetical protein